ncbi:MAG: helix-turn-helix transcriptional regulator [Halobacteria archaeon]|nr:helix-turn-helix transcriptional regulator [Halobacteria archaeon]
MTHPSDENGDFLPASENPDTLERFQIGKFLNVQANDENRSLDGELWIELAAVKWLIENDDELGDLAETTVQKLRDGDTLEVSTGYWHGVIPQAGEFDGHEFEDVQVDVLPDHLATLPNAEGACNWDGDRTESGCGAPRPDADVANQIAANTTPAALDYDGVTWADGPPAIDALQTADRRSTYAANDADADDVEFGEQGIRLASLINSFIEARVNEEDETTRSDVIGELAQEAAVTKRTVRMWANAEVTCPSRGRLAAIARVLDIPEDLVVETAKGDGCTYDQNSVEANASADGIDVALHRSGYDPDAIDAANLLDTARTPEYSGTADIEWSAPDLEDFVQAWGYDDVETVDDLTSEQKTEIAQTSLLGDADADTYDELVFFPVVVLSGRGAQADISAQQLESARGVARSLLEEEFGRDMDDNASFIDRVGDGYARVKTSFLESLGFDVDDRGCSDCSGDCDDCSKTATNVPTDPVDADDWPDYGSNQSDDSGSLWNMGQNNYDDDVLEAIANATDFTVDELRDAPEKFVKTLEAQIDLEGQSGDGSGDGSGTSNSGDQKVEELEQKIEALESRLDEQNSDRRDDLVDAIVSQTRFDEDDLDDLGIAEDVDKLERFADKQMVQVNTTPNYGGRAADVDDGDEFEVEIDGVWTNSDEDAQEAD